MSLSLVDANLAWQNVTKALANAHPGTQLAFRGLKQYLSQQRAITSLQFKAFTEADCDAAGGTAIIDAACTLYAVFTKKNTSATDNWFWLYDDATNDGTAADAMVCLPQLRASEQAFAVFPNGFALGTGIVVTQYGTDPLGAVDGSEGADGFVLIGAA